MVWKLLTNAVQMVTRADGALRVRQLGVLTVTMRQVAIRQGIVDRERYKEESHARYEGVPFQEVEPLRRRREIMTRLEKRIAEMEELILERPAFGEVYTTLEAMLEKFLYTNYHDEVLLALTNLVIASEQRNIFINPFGVTDGFQRFIMEIYMPYYMQMPQKHNLIGVIVTPLSMLILEGRHASSYVTGVVQGQDIKTKSLVLTTQRRALRAKQLASSKGRIISIPTTSFGEEHEELKKSDYIPIFHDISGKDMITVTILDAVLRKYLIGVWGARMVGYPEGYAYWQYPHISVILKRRGVRIRYRKRFLVPRWAEHIITMYLRGMRKFREVHGFYRPKRYQPRRRRRT